MTLALLLSVLGPGAGAAPAAADPAPGSGKQVWESEGGKYRLRYQTREPIVINHMHDWVLHVQTADGEPLTGARIAVTGGMPAHDHGLPTRPRVTGEIGGGDYLVEGMRFHMNGAWEITVSIEAGDGPDRVVVPLQL